MSFNKMVELGSYQITFLEIFVCSAFLKKFFTASNSDVSTDKCARHSSDMIRNEILYEIMK